MENPLNVLQDFLYTIRSTKTKEMYLNYLDYFTRYLKGDIGARAKKITKEEIESQITNQLENFLQLSPKDIERKIIDYVIHMRNNRLSYSSMRGRISAIVSFLELNDILTNKKKIEHYFGEHLIKKDFAYSMEDIQKMCSMATFRTKLITLMFSSTGIRREALIKLQLKHLKKIEEFDLYRFVIYEGTQEEYTTYCTPECAAMIDQYLDHRRNSGEKLTPESYLIRNHFDSNDPERVKNVKPVTGQDLNTMFTNLLRNAGLRQANSKKGYERHDKQIFHAFRKFWNSTLVKADVNQLVKEKLMGHSPAFDNSYLRLDEDKLLSEYVKSLDSLTVDPANRLKREVKILKAEKSQYESLKSEFEKFKDQVLRLQKKKK